MMFTRAFWRDAAERGIKTFCQTLVAILSAGGVGLLDAPWWAALSASGMATLLSLLTAIAVSTASKPGGDGGVIVPGWLFVLVALLVVVALLALMGVHIRFHVN